MLIYPPSGSRARIRSSSPLGLMSIASYVLDREASVEIKFVDYSVNSFKAECFQHELRMFNPEILGMSIITLNASSANVIAKLAKQHNPRILIVVGGVHATFLPETCLEYADIVVRGEGEETFCEIIQGYPLDSIAGISFRRNGEIVHNDDRPPIGNIDGLPFASNVIHLLEVEKYDNWGVMGSRGCPYRCIYCSSPRMWHRRLRYRSASCIVDEIERLHNALNIDSIMFFDDTLNIPQQRAFEVCDEIIKRGLNKKMEFTCMLRSNRQFVSSELFSKMREANFTRVEFGIESGSQRVLDSLHKSLTVEEAKRAVEIARAEGIPLVIGFFLIGSWDETFLDVLKSWHFILTTPVYPVFSITTPFPGTELYSILKQEGCLKGEVDWRSMNQYTVVSKTNKMSRPLILLLYVFSFLFFHFLLAFTRGRSLKETINGTVRLLLRS